MYSHQQTDSLLIFSALQGGKENARETIAFVQFCDIKQTFPAPFVNTSALSLCETFVLKPGKLAVPDIIV